jgi:preprotein translocase subunit SecG
MNWVGILLLIMHMIACGGLILIVLLQAGKGATLGASLGGGSSQTLFGAQSATFIGRATWVLAVLFMITSLLLTVISPWEKGGMQSQSGILQEEPIAAPPLGEESQSSIPKAGPLSDDVSAGTGQVQQQGASTDTAELPIDNSVQSAPEKPAVSPETPATEPEKH